MPDRVFGPKSLEHKNELHSHGINHLCYPGGEPSAYKELRALKT